MTGAAPAERALRRKLATEMPVSQRLGIRFRGAPGGGVRRLPLHHRQRDV